MRPCGKNILLCGKNAGLQDGDLFYYGGFMARLLVRNRFLRQVLCTSSVIAAECFLLIHFGFSFVEKFSKADTFSVGVCFLRTLKHDMLNSCSRRGPCER